MSHLLWKYYWENDVDKFCRLLAPVGYSQSQSKGPAATIGSPGAFGSSPRTTKSRKASSLGPGTGAPKTASNSLGKGEINSRDHLGLTILLRAASSTSPDASSFVEALLDHPAIDIYAQDYESGWNALHRALYNGNISIARLLLEKERKDLTGSLGGASVPKAAQLIKTKDHEGNSPFDVYNATIALRTLKVSEDRSSLEDEESDTDEGSSSGDIRLDASRLNSGNISLTQFLDIMVDILVLAKRCSHLEAIIILPSVWVMRMTDSFPSAST